MVCPQAGPRLVVRLMKKREQFVAMQHYCLSSASDTCDTDWQRHGLQVFMLQQWQQLRRAGHTWSVVY